MTDRPPSALPDSLSERLAGLRRRIAAAAPASNPVLLAVSKTRSAEEVAALTALGQTAFGENYVQEGARKRGLLADRAIEWHLVGHLQSNKAELAAEVFDWVQTVDRPKLLPVLGRHRPPGRSPLNVLIQVNVDDEASKSGCRPADVDALAAAIAHQERLRLRGLMAIPCPYPDVEARRPAFRTLRGLYDSLRKRQPDIDTLSMGMSDDFGIALEEGATMVRLGTALFGPRPQR